MFMYLLESVCVYVFSKLHLFLRHPVQQEAKRKDQ